VREARRVGHAVVVVPDRVDARAVAVAGARQRVEGPQVACADGKARRAVALHRLTGEVFEQLLGAVDVVEEGFASLRSLARSWP
jgi:hypothetical protein